MEKQQLGLKAGGVDLIIQKMEDDHQKKMAKADENLQSAVRSKEIFQLRAIIAILVPFLKEKVKVTVNSELLCRNN